MFYRGSVIERPGAPWLLLIHQLPPKPATLRVRTWRRLQAIGAVPIKNSVYVLPNTEAAREDLEWTLRQIQQEKGEASICEATLVDGLTDDEVQRSFQVAREKDYRDLAAEVRAFTRDAFRRRGRAASAGPRTAVEGALARFRKRLAEIGGIDFFEAPGREAVVGLLEELERRLDPAPGPRRPSTKSSRRPEDVRGRSWVTRAGVHVDRIASAWLIRRFIDPDARFRFVPARAPRVDPGELRFDMFEAEFSHQGDRCTFEVLVREFGLADRGLEAVAEIVHDIDLRDARFGRPETAGIEHLVAGICWMHAGDEERVAQGAGLFDSLHSYFKRRKS